MIRNQINFSAEEIKRYGRHLIMPEVGMEGQRKLKSARVLVIGTGGLGSPVSLYLAAAGVGTLGIVDFDVVDYSNLQRQVLFSTDDVGISKLDAAEKRIKAINQHVQIEKYETALTSENAMEILGKDWDVVIDGTDNFPTRYLVNDACVILNKPNIYGSIFRFEGQASVFYPRKGPCYRCLYPEPPPPGLVPSCAEGGVLGVLPGLIGMIQATETVKLIIGKGESLVGRLMLIDALNMTFTQLSIKRNDKCPVCSEQPTITELIDYNEFCGVGHAEAPVVSQEMEITAIELKNKIDIGESPIIVDVREEHEYQICKIPGSILIPLAQITERANELDTAQEIVLHCHSGFRSAKAMNMLKTIGFQKLKNLKGGIDAWSTDVDSTVPRY